jgi:hypothetical protein
MRGGLRRIVTGLVEHMRAQTETTAAKFSGAMMYRLLFQPAERSDEKVRAYVLKLFHQAGFRIPT